MIGSTLITIIGFVAFTATVALWIYSELRSWP